MLNKTKKKSFMMPLFFVIIIASCKGKSISNVVVKEDKDTIVNCYILKPVANDSKADWYKSLSCHQRKITEQDLSEWAYKKKNLEIDTSLEFITSFEWQKEIIINDNCIDKLSTPSSTSLQEIYFFSTNTTRTMLGNNVKFIKSYDKEIIDYGKAIIYEYSFGNGSTINPHFLHLIIKQKKDNNPYAEDYEGFALCSDSIAWKSFIIKNDTLFTPVLVKNTRIQSIYIPLIFDKNRFIPVGVLKITD